MFDKLLLVLLLILLPLGIVVSRQFTSESDEGTIKASDVNLDKLDELITQIAEQSAGKSQPQNQPAINITGVVYASDSGVLRVAGIAPSDKISLWLFINELENGVIVPEVDNAAAARSVFGKEPTVKALKPSAGGGFTFEYPVRTGFGGKVEVFIQQKGQSATVLFDIGNNKQIPLE